MTLTHIFIYPVKSLAGISLSQAQLTDRGLQYDRRWLLVEPSGRFLTQRQIPDMALLTLEQQEDAWLVQHKHKDISPLKFPMEPEAGQEMQVEVFRDQMKALTVSSTADAWFSAALGVPCKLVYMPDDSHRPVDEKYANKGEIVSFADGFPTMLLSQASLDHLNEKLDSPVSMDRFRPNLVVAGTEPHAEDQWGPFQIGGISFTPSKLCARCAIPNIDQETGEKGLEPTKTLVTYRRQDNKVNFGRHIMHEGVGELRVGMELMLES